MQIFVLDIPAIESEKEIIEEIRYTLSKPETKKQAVRLELPARMKLLNKLQLFIRYLHVVKSRTKILSPDFEPLYPSFRIIQPTNLNNSFRKSSPHQVSY